ncbi:class A beta-lactamase-related serine hydrolase [Modestobacter lapidis]|nr:serine hydrolase [Modestobacter lapidis]
MATLLAPVLAVVLALALAVVLAIGGALRAAGNAEQPDVALVAGAAAPGSAPGAGATDGSGTVERAVSGALATAAQVATAHLAGERTGAALAAVRDAAARAGGTVHVVVLGPDGREQLAGPGADQPVFTASLVKLLVVQQLFAREAAGLLPLSAGDLRLMERAVTSSDDGAMSTLWDRFGGAELMTAAAAQVGLRGTTLPAERGQWGEALTTARDTAVFLSRLPDQLAADDLATLTGWLRSPAAIARDGFDQRWGLLSPAVTTTGPVAAKQGWMCCIDGRRQLHSAGVLADGRTVVLLGDFPVTTSWARAKEALDAAAQAVVG